MKRLKWDRNSILIKFATFIMILIVMQSCLLIGTMIAGGVLSETERNSLQSFQENVHMQRDYLFKEMRNRWANIDPYVSEVAKSLPLDENEEKLELFFQDVAPTLLSMLRTTSTNGVFVILENTKAEANEHAAL